MKLPISKIRFNHPDAWPNADLTHKSVLDAIASTSPDYHFPLYHFRRNDDGTFTPLNRSYEWQIAVLKKIGRKSINLW